MAEGKLVVLKAKGQAFSRGLLSDFYLITWASDRPDRGVDDLVERVTRYLPFDVEIAALAYAGPMDVIAFQRRCSKAGAWIYGDWYLANADLERLLRVLNEGSHSDEQPDQLETAALEVVA